MSADGPAPHLVCSAVAPSEEAVRFDPAWHTSTVLALAQGIVRDGNFDAMPILADALQDAGCDNAILLEHCHCGTQHSKMCWVLDVVHSANSRATNRSAVPPTQRPILIEAAEMMSHIEDTFDDELACTIVPFSVFVAVAVFASIVDNFSGPVILAFPVMVVTPFAIIYLLLCCKVLRNRWRRRNSPPTP